MSAATLSVKLGRTFRFLRSDTFAVTALVLLLTVIASSLVGGFAFQDAARAVDLPNRNLPPLSGVGGPLTLLGTDALGRSIIARLAVGGLTTLTIAISAAATALAVGGMLGIVSGFLRGRTDRVVVRLADVLLSFPTLLLAVVLIFLFRPSFPILVTVLAATRVPAYIRVSRAEAMKAVEQEYVLAARSIGVPPLRLLLRHLLPVVFPSLLTLAAVDLGYIILLESSLSFLGQGVQPPGISWGLMVAEGRSYLLTAWWLTVMPGIAITSVTVSLNFLASWIRIANDPSQHWRLFPNREQVGPR